MKNVYEKFERGTQNPSIEGQTTKLYTQDKTKTNNNRQTNLKILGKLKVSGSCPTGDIRRATIVIIVNEERRTGLWLRQTEQSSVTHIFRNGPPIHDGDH